MFKFHDMLQDELDPENGGGAPLEPGFDEGGEAAGPDEGGEAAPSYFVGEFDEDTVVNRLKYAGELPDRLNALESRVGEQVSPLNARLDELQRSMGTQAAFEPKFEKLQSILKEYDPALAEKFMPALIEDLQGSLKINALDQSALEPFINPMLEAYGGQQAQASTSAMLDIVGIHPDELVAKDAQGNVLDAQTDIQKDFYSWWGLQDAATQAALKTYDLGLVQSLNKFKQWRAERTKEKGEVAGASSARLRSGQAPSPGGRRAAPAGAKSPAESFSSGFDEVMKELKGA